MTDSAETACPPGLDSALRRSQIRLAASQGYGLRPVSSRARR